MRVPDVGSGGADGGGGGGQRHRHRPHLSHGGGGGVGPAQEHPGQLVASSLSLLVNINVFFLVKFFEMHRNS